MFFVIVVTNSSTGLAPVCLQCLSYDSNIIVDLTMNLPYLPLRFLLHIACVISFDVLYCDV